MLLSAERQGVVDYCRKLQRSALVSGTSGNISAFNAAQGLLAISPSSMAYDDIEAQDVVVMDLAGRRIDGERRPSSESGMHIRCYRDRQDLGAIVHTHAPQATTLAILGWDLPAVHYMIAYSQRATIPCVGYELFGTEALAEAASRGLQGGYALLLQNHGTLTAGPTLSYAYAVTEQLEFCAGLYLRARALGEPKILSDADIDAVMAQFSHYTAQAAAAPLPDP